MKLCAGRWPLWYRVPLRMTRAELRWLAWLWLAYAYTRDCAERFERELFERFRESGRRLEALVMRPSPFLARVAEEASRAG